MDVMRSRVFTTCATLLALVFAATANAEDKAAEDVLKSKGLTKVGLYYVLDSDTKIPEGLVAIRQAKKRIEEYTKRKAAIEQELAATQANIDRLDQEYRDLNEEMSKWKDIYHHNKYVAQINS